MGQVVTFSPCQTVSQMTARKAIKFRRIRRDREWLLGQEWFLGYGVASTVLAE